MKTEGDIYTGFRGYFSAISLISDYPVSQIPAVLIVSFLSSLSSDLSKTKLGLFKLCGASLTVQPPASVPGRRVHDPGSTWPQFILSGIRDLHCQFSNSYNSYFVYFLSLYNCFCKRLVHYKILHHGQR